MKKYKKSQKQKAKEQLNQRLKKQYERYLKETKKYGVSYKTTKIEGKIEKQLKTKYTKFSQFKEALKQTNAELTPSQRTSQLISEYKYNIKGDAYREFSRKYKDATGKNLATKYRNLTGWELAEQIDRDFRLAHPEEDLGEETYLNRVYREYKEMLIAEGYDESSASFAAANYISHTYYNSK